jgi:hypothetical protein
MEKYCWLVADRPKAEGLGLKEKYCSWCQKKTDHWLISLTKGQAASALM